MKSKHDCLEAATYNGDYVRMFEARKGVLLPYASGEDRFGGNPVHREASRMYGRMPKEQSPGPSNSLPANFASSIYCNTISG